MKTGSRVFGSCNLTALTLACSVLFGVFGVACQKSDPASTQSGTAAIAASSAAVAPAPSLPPAIKKTESGCAGQYKGTYTVTPTKANITGKEGAPASWDKSDDKTLAGQGEITLKVSDDNLVSGSAKGALGEQTLRGVCDDNTLRVELDAAGDESNTIQNAVILAQLSGAEANGTLAAATGDSLVRRSGTVSLRKSE